MYYCIRRSATQFCPCVLPALIKLLVLKRKIKGAYANTAIAVAHILTHAFLAFKCQHRNCGCCPQLRIHTKLFLALLLIFCVTNTSIAVAIAAASSACV